LLIPTYLNGATELPEAEQNDSPTRCSKASRWRHERSEFFMQKNRR